MTRRMKMEWSILYQTAALIIMAAFYSCYMLKALRMRRRGIRTDQLGRGKAGKSKMIEIALKTVTFLVPTAEIVSIALNPHTESEAIRIGGIILSAAGTVVFIISVVTMRDSWRAGISKDDKTELVTDGIYRYSRNPAFLGFDLLYAGILLMFFNWPLLAVSALAMFLFHIQIVNVEEPFLQETFKEAYLDYKRTTGRYLGKKKF